MDDRELEQLHEREAMMADRQALRSALDETLRDHGLRLTELTWKEQLDKRTLTLSLKVSGSLDEQTDLPFDDGRR